VVIPTAPRCTRLSRHDAAIHGPDAQRGVGNRAVRQLDQRVPLDIRDVLSYPLLLAVPYGLAVDSRTRRIHVHGINRRHRQQLGDAVHGAFSPPPH